MGVTAFTKGYIMDAANDVLDQATVGHRNHTGRFVTRVNSISITTGLTAGVVTIRAHGTAGNIIMTVTTVASDTVNMTFSTPQDIGDLAVTTLPATNVVTVFTQ